MQEKTPITFNPKPHAQLITNNLDGKKEEVRGKPKKVDEELQTAVLFNVSADKWGSNPHKYPSTNKIVTGYHSQGLPFLITVDSSFRLLPEMGYSQHPSHAFIDTYVTPLMEDYAQNLSNPNKKKGAVTAALILKIAELRMKHAPEAKFTLAINTIFERNGTLTAASFSIGACGALMVTKNADSKDAEVSNLICGTLIDNSDGCNGTKVYTSKDAFDNYCQSGMDKVIKRNDISYYPSEELRGAQIVSYTYTPPSLQHVSANASTAHIHSSKKEPLTNQRMERSNLSLPINTGGVLLDQVETGIKADYKERCKAAREGKISGSFGDDCALGAITVPDAGLQSRLQQIIAIKMKTIEYLKWMDENASSPRFWKRIKHIHHGSRGRKRAQDILDAIDTGNYNYGEIMNMVVVAVNDSGSYQHSYSRFIYEAFNKDSEVVGKVTDMLFSRLKRGLLTMITQKIVDTQAAFKLDQF